MLNYNNLIGKKFNKLIILSCFQKKGIRRNYLHCNCKCDCGKEKIVSFQDIKRGAIKSCGCLYTKDINKYANFIGMKFNKLTILKFIRNKNNILYCKCKCDCGKEKVISFKSLKSYNTKSCGCLADRHDFNFYKKLIGKKFGKLTILSMKRIKNSQTSCLCICDCGNKKIVNLNAMRNGETKSCGCLHILRLKSKEQRQKMSSITIKRLQNNSSKFANHKYKYGIFFSYKNNKEIHYRSSYELAAYNILEKMSVVKSYTIENLIIPYIYNGIDRSYIPDILVTYINEEKEIIEIKPNNLLNDSQNIAKAEAAEKFAINNKMKFSIWTDKTHKLAA
jgi:hypothetical protein